MWTAVARIILRNRILWLSLIIGFTAYMGYRAREAQMDYEYARLLPLRDTTNLQYEHFQEIFGDEGNIIVVGISDTALRNIQRFRQWDELKDSLSGQPGVVSVLGISDAVMLQRNDSLQRFDVVPVASELPTNQAELDAFWAVLYDLPIYDGLLYNKETGATIMAISLEKSILDNRNRVKVVNNLRRIIKDFDERYAFHTHTSGFPYIRTVNAEKVSNEILIFVLLALAVTAGIMFFFFRSFRAMMFSMVVVIIAVIWSFGFIVLFGFKITLLTALIPPLLIVIGIPNCIFLLNKYHQEYVNHGNQIKALSRVIHKIGNATLMTNATTAAGFATFILTSSRVLVEFGILASVNIMMVFLLALLLIPIIFSFAKPPKQRHTAHLEKKWINKVVGVMVHAVEHRRKGVYMASIALAIIAIFGLQFIRKTGSLAEDLPRDAKLYQDLVFFEENFNGVLPFEVFIDTKRPRGSNALPTLQRLEALQMELAKVPELSKTLSISDLIKFSKQAFYDNKPEFYELPNRQDRNFIASYLSNSNTEVSLIKTFVDSTGQYVRVSGSIADVGTREMERIQDQILPVLDSIFDPNRYEAFLTGASVVFIKGTNYLVENLFVSLSLAIVLIALFMAFMFRSFKMVLISLTPNLLPLLLTSAIMGYFSIPIKPSTILVFSIAFGISVDDTIHFLAKFRQELKLRNWDIRSSVIAALRETAVSMTYTSIVLFFGFSIFIASEFGGTVALGLLVSITLFFAMMANLLLLPSLLLGMADRINRKNFMEPAIHLVDDESPQQIIGKPEDDQEST